MKRYRFTYFIGQSFKGLWRNGIMSIASITVLMSCLVVIGSFALLILNIDINLEKLGLLNEIVVFIDGSKTDEEVAAIGEQINALDNIDSVDFISKEQALEEERQRYEDYPELFEQIENDNPLRDSFVITYIDNAKASTLAYQLGQIDGIATVNVRLDLAVTIEKLKNGISLVLVWFMAILFAVSIFVIINTIKLAVHSRRTEISIMRYIGATEWFVILPFIFEGIIIGIISSLLAYLIEGYMYSYVVSMIDENFKMVTILDFASIRTEVVLAFIAIGVVTGIIGSTISTRKYLKA
ncbi:MAG TPA: permease-like cell division protein FtsX [Firmicutes bacterium]|nr:permease-like cell division protein FtsX [Bacillota bacterium]